MSFLNLRTPRARLVARLAVVLAVLPACFAAALPARAEGWPSEPGTAAPAGVDERTEVEAGRIDGANQEYLHAEGAVRLRRGAHELSADRLSVRLIEEEVVAEGNVRLVSPGYELLGPRLKLRLADRTGTMEAPTYRFETRPGQRKAKPGSNPAAFGPATATAGPFSKGQGAHGSARRIEIEGENHYRMEGATYSTCTPGDNSWFAKFSELNFDYDRLEGEGTGARLVFKGVPIFYLPYLNFPLSSGRRSGFLSPTLSRTSNSGFEWQVPYYWNIAPNLDATITAHGYAQRGQQMGIDQRYLFVGASGDWHADVLPNDRNRGGDTRYRYRWRHRQDFGRGVAGQLEYEHVSDDVYFKDFSTQIVNAAQTLLARTATVSWHHEGWATSLRALRYQVLQPDPANPTERPYELLPQLSVIGRSLVANTVEAALNADYTRFYHRDAARIQGGRAVFYPKLSLPLVWPGYYLTPRLGLHYTRYAFDQPVAGIGDDYARTVPIGSVDAGLVFEREAHAFGRRQIQTLEPRFFYLKVPFKDQGALTRAGVNFDSGVLDFNFAQVFAEQNFSGSDRIADADQATIALSSRLIDQDSGREYFRALLGQRYYLADQRVTLAEADKPRTENKTDVLGALSGEMLPKTFVDAAIQFNPRQSKSERFSVGARYQPAAGQVANLGYRYGRSQVAPFEVNVKNVDFSAQWPLLSGWRLVGRYNYSLLDQRQVESLAGFEYYSGCWASRVVAQRFATTSRQFTDAIFVQLEFKDFGQFGLNPFDALNRSVPGYNRQFPYEARAADGAR